MTATSFGAGVLRSGKAGPLVDRSIPADCSPILDEAYQLLSTGQVRAGMDLLMGRLSDIRKEFGAETWDAMFQSEALNHPVSHLVWQDPFTDHSFRKPRGYPGDAALLDFIYGFTPIPAETSPLGEAIFRYNRERQAPRSVRSRAQILARTIDETAGQFQSPRVLSIACGHLREAEMSRAVMEGRIGEFIALDQDRLSLAEVTRSYARRGVVPVEDSVRSVLSEKVRFNDLHLAYAAGLYDYLSDRVAARLTRLMFDMLAPGGKLLVANFAPCIEDLGYIESYMGWKLIYRNSEQMAAVGSEISPDEWKSHRLFWDEHESIIFLEIVKRGTRKPTMTFGPDLNKVTIPGMAKVTLGAQVAGAGQSPARHRNGNGHANGNGNGASNANGNGHGEAQNPSEG